MTLSGAAAMWLLCWAVGRVLDGKNGEVMGAIIGATALAAVQ